MNNDARRLRNVARDLGGRIARAARPDRPVAEAVVATVTGLGAGVHAVGPVFVDAFLGRLTGTEAAGSAASVDSDAEAVAIALTRGSVQDGDRLLCELIDGYWCAEYRGTPPTCATATLTVRVVDGCSGLPISGATVTATGGGGPYTGTTDASGYVTLTVDPFTSYTLHADYDGYRGGDRTVSVACSGATTLALSLLTVCVAVTGCNGWALGFGMIEGADVTVTETISGSTASGTTDADGRVCLQLQDVETPTSPTDLTLEVAVVGNHPGLADRTVTVPYAVRSRCGPSAAWPRPSGPQEDIVVGLDPAPGFVCCCPTGTPDTLFYSDDYGSCTAVWDNAVGGWVGEYEFVCGCGADLEVCSGYGYVVLTSDPYAKAIRARIVIGCNAAFDGNAGHGLLRFNATRTWGYHQPFRCGGFSVPPIDCPGFPSTSWDDPDRYGQLIETALTDVDDAAICEGDPFSLNGTYHAVTATRHALTVAVDRQACSATSFTVSS